MPTTLQRAYENLRSGEAVFRDVGRFRQIVAVLARHGFGAVLQQLSLRDEWLVKKLLELRAGDEEHLPIQRRVLLAIHELGPTFVKLGQILSTRPDLLPPAWIDELTTLQDAVPPMPLDDVRKIIRTELGGEVEDLFDDFSPEPLASASIAQVHRARLEGRDVEVVVKVQRAGIRSQIEADVEIMGFLARALEANFPDARLYSAVGIVSEFERAIRREMDFGNELDHIERFRRNFRDQPEVHFPIPYRDRCSTCVLTMEFIDGTKISSITPDRFDVDRVVRTALNAVLQMIHADGFFHGDLHPGNLFVRDDNTLCFIDFGLVGSLSMRQRDHLADLLTALVRQDFPAVARTFWKIGVHGKESTRQYELFETDVVECMEHRFGGKKVSEIEFSAFFKDLVAMALKHRIRMPADYTMTFKAVITMEGVAKQLIPDMDITAAVQPYVAALLAERYSPRRLARSAYDALRDLSDTLGSLPDTSRAILEDVRAGRAQLGVEINHVEEIQRTWVRVHERNRLALLIAASALCGTLALDFQTWAIAGFPAVSLCFYLVAGLLAVRYFASGSSK